VNFFEQQEAARQSSRLLIVLFALAVIAVVLAVDGTAAAAYYLWFGGKLAALRQGHVLPLNFLLGLSVAVLFVVAGGTVVQILELRAGGEAVARMVGGRAVDLLSQDPAERRLLNVVEEMALASGIAAPRCYVMDREEAINAFAAGIRPGDAVVTVTRGALQSLTRDELQGVIGHEMSHILNGDMRLNLRLIGLLHGLISVSLLGGFIMSLRSADDGSSRGRRNAIFFAVGLCLWIIGSIGVLCGRLIKAAVSRQREFLADASSVQFTRNPDGIGGALRKIGGMGGTGLTPIEHMHAETLSHMFIAPVSLSLGSGWLASHPPLEERLRRIYGRAVDFVAVPRAAPAPDGVQARDPFAVLPQAAGLASAPGAGAAAPGVLSPVGGAAAASQGDGGAAQALHATIGQPVASSGARLAAQLDALGLRPALADAAQAQLLVMAMLLDPDAKVQQVQTQAVVARYGAHAQANVQEFAAAIARLPPGWRLPLLDLAMPALRSLDPTQRAALLALAQQLIKADGRVTLAEFLLFSVLGRRLAPPRGGGGRAVALDDVGPEAALVLSLISCVRLPQEPQRAFAAARTLLPACGPFVAQGAIRLEEVSRAFDRLARLAPLQKPALIKASMAACFVDGRTQWRAASCLRTLCAAIDCPLPPQLQAAEDGQELGTENR
jgi:Zn-dependent protease with chaperone function